MAQVHSFGDVSKYRDKHQHSELQEKLWETPSQCWVMVSMPGPEAQCLTGLLPQTLWHQPPWPLIPKVSNKGLSDLWPSEGSKHCRSAGRHHLLNKPKSKSRQEVCCASSWLSGGISCPPLEKHVLRPRGKSGSTAVCKQSICLPSPSPVSDELHCLARVTQAGWYR